MKRDEAGGVGGHHAVCRSGAGLNPAGHRERAAASDRGRPGIVRGCTCTRPRRAGGRGSCSPTSRSRRRRPRRCRTEDANAQAEPGPPPPAARHAARGRGPRRLGRGENPYLLWKGWESGLSPLGGWTQIISPRSGQCVAVAGVRDGGRPLCLETWRSFTCRARGSPTSSSSGRETPRALPAGDKAVNHYEMPDSPGYDSQWYSQIAVRPHLSDPGLAKAVDSLPYRARRILFLWTAWLAGGGNPPGCMNVYALQNIVCWFILAALLLRWFPPVTWGNCLRWAAMLFSFGLIFSVQRRPPGRPEPAAGRDRHGAHRDGAAVAGRRRDGPVGPRQGHKHPVRIGNEAARPAGRGRLGLVAAPGWRS